LYLRLGGCLAMLYWFPSASSASLLKTGFQCLCRSTQSKFIPPKAIQNVRPNQRGPHRKNVEIIAALEDGSHVFLEPSVPWVRLTVRAISAR
uniref:Chemokine interleukin-8-like domain-containing protein n=1 Tax=Calidris pygmaea TaxID=425635 RepID=A0A8C3J6W4_9CHAR